MSPDKLIHMANQIALFFESKPHAEGVAGVAGHINDFWEPRMRRELLQRLAEDPGGFHPLVVAAHGLIRDPDAAAA